MPHAYAILTAEINPASSSNFIQFLAAHAAQPPDSLTIAINCGGGGVVAGIAIYNAMIAMPYPIITHNIGNVDSIANVIFLAGGTRYACPASTFMFHGVGFNSNPAERLEEKNLREKLDVVTSDHKRISNIIAGRTSLSVKQGTNLFKQQRTRDAVWAKDNGLVSDIRDFAFPVGGQIAMFA